MKCYEHSSFPPPTLQVIAPPVSKWLCNPYESVICNTSHGFHDRILLFSKIHLTFSPWKRHGRCPPTFLQRQPNSFSSHSIYVKDNFYLIFSSKKVWYQKIILMDFISKFHSNPFSWKVGDRNKKSRIKVSSWDKNHWISKMLN